jgi:hypothetical protein
MVVRMLIVLSAALPAAILPARGATREADWTDIGILSAVVTDGNSESFAAGLKNSLGVRWGKSSFELQTGGYRTKTTSRIRFAFGPSASQFDVVELKTEVKVESYKARTRYDRIIAKRLYWLVGEDWERNELMGLEDRFIDVGGVGGRLIDTEHSQFRIDFAATRTREVNLADDPLVDDEFAGARVGTKSQHTFSTGATVGHELVVDQNLEHRSDRRADLTAWVTFAAGPRLGLQVTVETLYDWEPALQEIPRFSAPLVYSGENVRIPFDESDTIFSTSLVLFF